MSLTLYQVDAFASKLFTGNPAAVVVLPDWLDDALLQSISTENNLSETAFVVPMQTGEFALRWFTPTSEVPLCGHATLAAAYVLNTYYRAPTAMVFNTLSGKLRATKAASGGFTIDMPAAKALPTANVSDIAQVQQSLGTRVSALLEGDFYMAVLASADAVATVKPNFNALALLNKPAVIVTAAGQDVDFVSRFFAPKIGINEDPVTGAAHCLLVPYWANVLESNSLRAYQMSQRGGYIDCALQGDRVLLTGQVVTYLVGTLHI